MKQTIEIYTDGACKGNPGPGGWGALIKIDGKEIYLSGADVATTNNRMELMGAIQALISIQDLVQPDEDLSIILTTDSNYVKEGITTWMHNWKKNNWRTAAKTPVKNQDLWLLLDSIVHKYDIQWRWVKGHSGHRENEIVDELARQAILTLSINE